MSLQARLDAHKENFVAKAKPEILQTMQDAKDGLLASGILERVVQVGQPAPEFSLTTTAGQSLSLADLRAQGPVVLNFYRGKW